MSVVIFSLRSLVKRNLSLLLVALFVIVAASALHAQIVETGIITGVVKDNTGAVIPGAHVTVRNSGTGLTTNTSTDAQGIYVSPPLHPGDYVVVPAGVWHIFSGTPGHTLSYVIFKQRE